MIYVGSQLTTEEMARTKVPTPNTMKADGLECNLYSQGRESNKKWGCGGGGEEDPGQAWRPLRERMPLL